nr:MAG TPA: hypothetical protein [Caudoviricetes sp.]
MLNNTYYCIDIAKKLNITDWSAVKVDTKILVKNNECDIWKRRYFACYENGKVYAYCGGKTSWSAWNDDGSDIVLWEFAEVVEE